MLVNSCYQSGLKAYFAFSTKYRLWNIKTYTFLCLLTSVTANHARGLFLQVPKPFGSISGATIPFIPSQRRGSRPSHFAILSFSHIRNMLKDQLFKTSIKVWQLAFRARKPSSRDFRETGSCTLGAPMKTKQTRAPELVRCERIQTDIVLKTKLQLGPK